jgi:hypothetical protein
MFLSMNDYTPKSQYKGNLSIQENVRRNKLVVTLRDSGLTYDQIRVHPEVVKLTGGVMTRQRVYSIYKVTKEKGGAK